MCAAPPWASETAPGGLFLFSLSPPSPQETFCCCPPFKTISNIVVLTYVYGLDWHQRWPQRCNTNHHLQPHDVSVVESQGRHTALTPIILTAVTLSSHDSPLQKARRYIPQRQLWPAREEANHKPNHHSQESLSVWIRLIDKKGK